MENYICINGKKAELTEEQMKALGIELPKTNPFKRADNNTKYWVIHQTGVVDWHYEVHDSCDNDCFNTANYCTDKAIMEQRALHETLNRLLWRYSMEHDGDKIELYKNNEFTFFYVIYYHHRDKAFYVTQNGFWEYCGAVYFYTAEIANAAIEEIIKPFMAAHPNFKFYKGDEK